MRMNTTDSVFAQRVKRKQARLALLDFDLSRCKPGHEESCHFRPIWDTAKHLVNNVMTDLVRE